VSLLQTPARVLITLCLKIYLMEWNVRRKSAGGPTRVKQPSALPTTSNILLFLTLSSYSNF